ncbi:host attachment protein [Paraburkholderia caballeronis]|uniref:host attachment protein n=1 Tax=Paraburkholderia caballeronis TaxID=416943 RepID=UPI0010EEB1D6|nr:host attachment protein [Paraburkholderia caballeronis]TDV14395.1 protein required for attachment to host cells [Paraburkholderia caballeronis]TDV15921.1 protein required for attachment to host cells [Paraburkholderia caballeronis]TDV25182.1 protein required for attachment to host cells [Paraburkholderia caballeronis]
MTKTIWIAVANRATARIFTADSPLGALDEIETLIHPAGRAPEQSLVTDKPGRTYDRAGTGRHADSDTTQHDHEAAVFAAEIAACLAKGRETDRFGTLIVAAPPAFLGELRKHLDAQTQNLVTLELDKDLAHLGARELRAYLPERLVRHEA